ncbi:MAG: D-alanyl-D-alanine carboxypeptidase [Ilumatobacteraceae bacterium]|nr:D-alanyl-D-alanine carboxypeptidase [Ilumatobacteraceae bacterium]
MKTTMEPSTHRALRTIVTMTAAGALLVATACSSSEDTATAATAATAATPPTSAVPPTSTAPPTTTVPPTTTAPPTTSVTVGPHAAMLDDVLAAHQAAGEFVGARIALLDRDGTVTEVTAGTSTADPASSPVDPDVPWNIGSVTKTFVAVVVLQLADEGRIDLDAGIDRFLPDLPGADRITPRELLQRTSGLGEYINDAAVVNDAQRKWSPDELIAIAEASGRFGDAGGPHHYSNTNFVVLGEIIEQVTGNSWSDEVNTRIVEPLGMTSTSNMVDERPPGYAVVDGSIVDATFSENPSLGGAAGSLQSTGRDLLRLATALADGTLLSPASQAAMHTFVPAEDYSQFGIDHGYGLGLEQFANESVTVDGHMGTGFAQSAFLGYDTEHHTAVAVMTNTAIAGPQAVMAVEALTGAMAAG